MSEKITAKYLRTSYSMGERDFSQLQLRRINLQKAKLQGINLQGSDLREADLREADLTDANLSNCYLSEANFNNTNLMGANLTGAYLIKANCQKAILKKADFTNAFLTKANLSKADLNDTIFNGSYLSGTIFQEASYNDTTVFDKELDLVKLGMIKSSLLTAIATKKVTIAELVSNFENITSVTINYLGGTITVKNFEKSRPNIEWLQQFSIDKQGKISYQGLLTNKATLIQLKWLERWTNSFVKKSSFILNDLPKIINEKQLIY